MNTSLLQSKSTRKLVVILHADVAGSTVLVQQHESIAHTRMQDAFQRLASIIEIYGGVAHEIRGDALLAEFARASDAVGASLAFQENNRHVNYEIKDDIKPVMRIGIALGEVVIADKTLTGEGVVIAQRIEQLTEPGGISIQSAAQETLPQRLPYDYCLFGEQKLKGLENPLRYCSVSLKQGEVIPGPESQFEPEPINVTIKHTSSIAVLPLDNMSDEPGQQYFADGITEDIITALSRFHDLQVTARNSSSVYRNKATDAREIGRDLGVHYLLEGSVRKLGDQVRVSVQLIDALSGSHMWAERFDRRLEDVFLVQDEITEMVVTTLAIRVEEDVLARAQHKSTYNQDAYDLVLRGDREIIGYTSGGSTRARELYFRAIDIDPACARAYVGIAFSFLSDWGYDCSSTTETLWRAVDFARVAVSIDDNHSRSHWVLAYVLAFNRDYDEADAHLQTALSMNPNDADVIIKMGYILPLLGYYDKAIEVAEKAIRLNPHHPDWYKTFLGFAYYTGHRYEEAIAAFVRSGNVYRDDIAWRAAALAQIGRIDDARAVTEKLLSDAGDNPWWTDVFNAEIDIEHDSTGMLTYMYHMYPFRNPDDFEHLMSGLRKAGF